MRELFLADKMFQYDPVFFQGGLVPDGLFGNVQQALFCEMRDKPGVCAVIENGGGRPIGPPGRHFADLELLEIKGFFEGCFFVDIGVGVPFLDGGVRVQNIVFMAPGNHVDRINVPRKVEDHPAGRHIFGKGAGHVHRGDSLAGVADAFPDPGSEFFLLVFEVQDGDVSVRDLDVLEQEGKGASSDRAESNTEDFFIESHHEVLLLVVDLCLMSRRTQGWRLRCDFPPQRSNSPAASGW